MTAHTTDIRSASELRLSLSRRDTGVILRPDGRYPGMWRVYWPDGVVSPMGNLTRAKDAALVYARQQPGFTGQPVHRWQNCIVGAVDGPPAAVLGLAGR